MKIITNTQNVNNFSEVDFQDANVVVVTNAKYRDIAFLKVEDGENEEEVVKSYLSELTFGCSYRYEIIKKIGNTYFCN